MELRCKEYAGGGYELWAKGFGVVKMKDKLAEDVYRKICGWNAMGDFVVDELVKICATDMEDGSTLRLKLKRLHNRLSRRLLIL